MQLLCFVSMSKEGAFILILMSVHTLDRSFETHVLDAINPHKGLNVVVEKYSEGLKCNIHTLTEASVWLGLA